MALDKGEAEAMATGPEAAARGEVLQLVELLTCNAATQLDAGWLHRLKRLCRSDPANLDAVFEELAEAKLQERHSHVRLLSVLLIDQLFMRSRHFRRLFVPFLRTFLQLAVGPPIPGALPLPPPSDRAEMVKDQALECVDRWSLAFGSHSQYVALPLARRFLTSTLGLQMPDLRERVRTAGRERREREERVREVRRRKYEKVKEELEGGREMEKIRAVLSRVEECVLTVEGQGSDVEVGNGTQIPLTGNAVHSVSDSAMAPRNLRGDGSSQGQLQQERQQQQQSPPYEQPEEAVVDEQRKEEKLEEALREAGDEEVMWEDDVVDGKVDKDKDEEEEIVEVEVEEEEDAFPVAYGRQDLRQQALESAEAEERASEAQARGPEVVAALARLGELLCVVENQCLPATQEWQVVLARVDDAASERKVAEALLKRVIDLRGELVQARDRCLALGVVRVNSTAADGGDGQVDVANRDVRVVSAGSAARADITETGTGDGAGRDKDQGGARWDCWSVRPDRVDAGGAASSCGEARQRNRGSLSPRTSRLNRESSWKQNCGTGPVKRKVSTPTASGNTCDGRLPVAGSTGLTLTPTTTATTTTATTATRLPKERASAAESRRLARLALQNVRQQQRAELAARRERLASVRQPWIDDPHHDSTIGRGGEQQPAGQGIQAAVAAAPTTAARVHAGAGQGRGEGHGGNSGVGRVGGGARGRGERGGARGWGREGATRGRAAAIRLHNDEVFRLSALLDQPESVAAAAADAADIAGQSIGGGAGGGEGTLQLSIDLGPREEGPCGGAAAESALAEGKRTLKTMVKPKGPTTARQRLEAKLLKKKWK